MSRYKENFSTRYFNRPVVPEPVVIAIRQELDYKLLQMDQVNYPRYVKQRMCRELAEHILDKCNVFDASSIGRGPTVQMELTLYDRGSYENMLPIAESRGEQKGREQERELIKRETPYGFEVNSWYE